MYRDPLASEAACFGASSAPQGGGGEAAAPLGPQLSHTTAAAAAASSIKGPDGSVVRSMVAAPSITRLDGSVVRSMAERYYDMLSTSRLRITCGKSAIHGLGAFAKVAHSAGERRGGSGWESRAALDGAWRESFLPPPHFSLLLDGSSLHLKPLHIHAFLTHQRRHGDRVCRGLASAQCGGAA